MNIKEIPQAELQKWHYQALKNPQYQMEGLFSVLQEELMMNMPNFPEEVKSTAIAVKTTTIQPSYILQRLTNGSRQSMGYLDRSYRDERTFNHPK